MHPACDFAMPLIILRLKGGLGNQLFQLAAAAFIAYEWKSSVLLDLTALSSYKAKRNFAAAGLISCDNNLFRVASPCELLLLNLISPLRLGLWMPFASLGSNEAVSVLKSECMRKILLSKKNKILFLDSYYLEGWTYETFAKAVNLLRVNVSALIPVKYYINDEYVALHFRGGDFIRSSDHNICSYTFYAEAVSRSLELGIKKYIIVSDDTLQASRLIHFLCGKFKNISFCLHPQADALADLSVLIHSSARIIGNSTFAYWSAVFAPDESPTFTCPFFSSKIPKTFRLQNEIWLD